jgi:hypothetical protein
MVSKQAMWTRSGGKPARMRARASLDASMAPCMEPDLSMRNMTWTSASVAASATALRAALSAASSSFSRISLLWTFLTMLSER